MSDIPPILHQILAGRYVLKREIGRGGAATVYLAHDVRHERLVAIKVLHPELSHALGAQRFLREIKLTASLQHPHILPIHDSGEADGQLFYVMPYVEGDSLRARLGADNRLSVEETVRIGREVAGALAYAHERGVVHRDIKPENILFSGGHAVLADFGIARAINRASEKITHSGTITGTPAYMSPEQARDRAFDGRTDVYSLSCVLYEAIAGVPPYVGDTPQQLLSQRIAKAPPLLREYRHDVPAPIEAVIAKALSISPDDRYDDARAFSAAMSAAIGNSGETLTFPSRRRPLSRNPWAIAAGVSLLLAGGAAASPRGRDELDVLTRRVDSTEYAVLPFQYVGVAAPPSDAEPASSAMYDVMRQWDGLPLAGEMEVSDAVRSRGGGALTLDEVARIARGVRAGRAVWGRVRVTRDSLVVRANVYDALSGTSLREVTRVVHGQGVGALHDADFRAIVSDLLRETRGAMLSTRADRGTTSYAAWQSFERGAEALEHWDVPVARSAFARAVALDPAYPHANLWLAQLHFLSDSAPKAWATSLATAQRGRHQLDAREQLLVDALARMSVDDHPGACRVYDSLRVRDSLDAMAWLGLSLCRLEDRGIVPSRASPSGYAFRASSEAAWRATARALEIAPEAFTLMSYEMLQRALVVEQNRLRMGRTGSRIFVASPFLRGDSVAYAPFPVGFDAADMPADYDGALRFNRDRMLGLLELLARRMPESPDAFEALASILEVRDEITGTPNGRYSALTALERARMLATSPAQRLRLAVADVRLHLKLGDIARSTSMADSVLAAQRDPAPADASWLRGLAAFAGRGALAAHYERVHGPGEMRELIVTVPAAEDAVAELTMRTALGLCGDSSAALVRSIDRTLASYVDAVKRPTVRAHLLERSITMSAPCDGGRASLQLGESPQPMVRMEQRIARGDASGARRIMDSLTVSRRSAHPGGMSLDYVVLEAWVRDATGDAAAAAARLDVALNALPALAPVVLTEPVLAASVGRSMAYRAELAERMGDHGTAALWAGRVLTLWAHADPSLAPVMDRMRLLAAHRPAR